MLSLEKVSITFNNKVILNQVNLSINQQEKVAITGDSGSGKTTLFNLILLNLKPNQGKIFFNHQNIVNYGYVKKQKYKKYHIAHVCQSLYLFESLTIYQNLTLFYPNEEVELLLKQTHFYEIKDKKVGDLSGGQKQKVAIIRACLSHADLYLFDEITSALDDQTAKEILDFTFELLKDKTILLITHHLDLIKPYVNSIYHLQNQQLKSIKKSAKLKNKQPHLVKKKKKKYHILSHECLSMIKKPWTILIFLIISLLTCLAIYQNVSFEQRYQQAIKDSINQYYDQSVISVINDTTTDERFEYYDSLDIIFNQIKVYYKESLVQQYEFKPVFKTDEIIVINQKLYKNNFINHFNQCLSFTFQEWCDNQYITFNLDFKSIKIIQEQALFSKSYIYYNYFYFKDYFEQLSLSSYIHSQQTNHKIINIHEPLLSFYYKHQHDSKITNNPFSENFDMTESYYYSSALLDLYANELLFTSSKKLTSLFLLFCLFGSIVASGLFFYSLLYKNYKKIAIYLDIGASHLECFFNIYILLIIAFISNTILYLLCKWSSHYFLYSVMLPLIGYTIILLIVVMLFIKKNLNEFLKDDEQC